jgi:hypothetical protein
MIVRARRNKYTGTRLMRLPEDETRLPADIRRIEHAENTGATDRSLARAIRWHRERGPAHLPAGGPNAKHMAGAWR